MTPPQDQEPDEDLRAYEELHEAEPQSSFFEARWWRWVGIGVAALIVLTFTLPLLTPFLGGNVDAPQPPSTSGTRMPDFLLPAAGGGTVRLSDETRRNDAVVLVFYRGYF